MKDKIKEILIDVYQIDGRCEDEAAERILRLFSVSGQSELLNCDHEWRVEKFDCYGFPAERYCDKCGKIEAV